MKISDFVNEDALDLLVDCIEPVSRIMSDKTFVASVRGGKKMEAIKLALKNHKREVIELLAALDGKKVEEYKANIIVMTKQLLELLNDEELMSVFRSQDQKILSVASIPVTETTQEDEK